MKNFLICILTLAASACFALQDFRPPLDKSQGQRTVWTEVNPWFPMDKGPIHDLGGPNRAYKDYSPENVWGKGMLECEKYGMTGWQVEINEPSDWTGTYITMLQQAKAVGSKLQLGMFWGFCSKTPQDSLKNAIRILGKVREDLKNNPNVGRIAGRPFISIYNPGKYKPEEWKMIFDGIEAEFGPMVFLGCFSDGDMGKLEANLRKYLPYFDGVSNYGSLGHEWQRKRNQVLAKLKKDFPQKWFEGTVHSTYTCHFHMGGLDVPLSKNYRGDFDSCLALEPDSITITNLFDHYENSLIFPCYDREDFMLRYMQCRLADWMGKEPPKQKSPELVLTNHCIIILGRQKLDFEVIGFPIDAERKEISVRIELCNTYGEVLRTLPPRKMVLDKVCVEAFSVPSTDFADERAIIPRLVYVWQGSTFRMNYNPMTMLSPSLRPYRMYWARSTKNALQVKGAKDWQLNGVPQGGTCLADTMQYTFSGRVEPLWGQASNVGIARHGIMRDGLEFYFSRENRQNCNSTLALQLPQPGASLHYYYLELANANGNRWQSLPIWHTDGTRATKVTVPVWKEDGSIQDYQIEGARVPFFWYPCEQDGGKLLLDASGYGHNGAINGSGFGGGHLRFTGYNYYHNGAVGNIPEGGKSLMASDEDGTRYLHFSGQDSIMIMGGTAFPGASTYELTVRPAEIGKLMGLIGTGNNQISLNILPDGHLQALRKSAVEADGGKAPSRIFDNSIKSKRTLAPGKWYHIAAVYDLRTLKLYIDGELEGEVAGGPVNDHQFMNFLVLGARNKWLWDPVDKFTGDIRNVRFYGRNLAPSEFLNKDTKATVMPNPYERKYRTAVIFQAGKQDAEKFAINGSKEKFLENSPDGLLLTKPCGFITKEKFQIDPKAKYRLSFNVVNNGSKSFSFYYGFVGGPSSIAVHTVPGTETEVLADAPKGARELIVADASSWSPKGYVAFEIDPEGNCADLPNGKFVKCSKPEKQADGTWKIPLIYASPHAGTKGSKVRQHCEGPTYNWMSSVWLEPGKSVEVHGTMQGISAGCVESGKFWPGTRNVQLIFVPVTPPSDAKLLFNNFKFEKVDLLSE